LLRRQANHRDDPTGLLRVLGEVRQLLDMGPPERALFGVVDDARGRRKRLGVDLDGHSRLCPQVVQPDRILGRSTLARGDDVVTVVARVGQDRAPRLARLRAGHRQHEQRVAGQWALRDLARMSAHVGDDVVLERRRIPIGHLPSFHAYRCGRNDQGGTLAGSS